MLDVDPGSESNPAVAEWESAGLRAPDLKAVRLWRLEQLRKQLEAENAAGIVLFDPAQHPLRARRNEYAGVVRP